MADRASEIRYQTINTTGAGTHLLVAAEAGYEILVVGLSLQATGTDTVTIQDETVSLLDASIDSDRQYLLPVANSGWVRGTADERLDIVVAAAVDVFGVLVYRMMPTGMHL